MALLQAARYCVLTGEERAKSLGLNRAISYAWAKRRGPRRSRATCSLPSSTLPPLVLRLYLHTLSSSGGYGPHHPLHHLHARDASRNVSVVHHPKAGALSRPGQPSGVFHPGCARC
ncbi:MAG: hypothetical protein DRK00_08185 [Thermoprotei archaeon]|nr:MAG: hypothetical protein DRK00_08185 [Thermoprotei archaeon]